MEKILDKNSDEVPADDEIIRFLSATIQVDKGVSHHHKGKITASTFQTLLSSLGLFSLYEQLQWIVCTP